MPRKVRAHIAIVQLLIFLCHSLAANEATFGQEGAMLRFMHVGVVLRPRPIASEIHPAAMHDFDFELLLFSSFP